MTPDALDALISEGLGRCGLAAGERVLLIVPDTTRTAPVALLTRIACRNLWDLGCGVDLMVALGTHPPLRREDLLRHLGLTEAECASRADRLRLRHHRWDDPSQLCAIGRLSANRVGELTGGLMAEAVTLTVNTAVRDCGRVVIIGPVFPHEIAGFSGGSKYLFPGISGPQITDFFHWLGAVIGNLRIIGRADNPVRRVLDAAAAMMPVPVTAVSVVVSGGEVVHCSVGPLPQSWRPAAEESARRHVVRTPRRYRRVLACAPAMYDDLWTGAKCMYKCEPVVEDGGELIIYAPHVASFSVTHGRLIEQTGYHLRDHFLQHMERYAGVSRTVLAYLALVKGAGVCAGGVERPRIRVSVASGISRQACERAGIGYADPASIRLDEWRGREEEGVLLVEKAGETLYLPRDEGLRGADGKEAGT